MVRRVRVRWSCLGIRCDYWRFQNARAAVIAALYVQTGGCYFGLPDVDPWDEARDARLYDGPHPVVAHPPCQRWGRYWAGSPFVIARTGKRFVKGDDDGCFAAALGAVRNFGGILEHPEASAAWTAFGLNRPPRDGAWVVADFEGGWTCCVEQGHFGHYARKPTWLYAHSVELPSLPWHRGERRLRPELVERHGLKKAIKLGELSGKGGGRNDRDRAATPELFRDLLLSIARTAKPQSLAA
jgi:hypothetical protein